MNKIRCIITICLAAMTMAASAQTATSNHNFEVAKNLDIFNALYRDLDLYYVDTLDAAKNIDNAANYMLEMLDPYTEYYAEDNSADLRQLTTGKYVGIGALTTFRPDLKRCIVAQPFAGMPAKGWATMQRLRSGRKVVRAPMPTYLPVVSWRRSAELSSA